ncbi:MAG TPA: hypothetical protein VM841_12165 [Actinomycetota bacterium]|nr:hypothetical protein [Actinomycetota bacterium]
MKPTTDTTLALALALDGAAAPATDEIKRLSGIAGLVDALPDPEIDSRFVARLEATLMAEYDAKFGTQAESSPAPLRIVKSEPQSKTEQKAEPKAAPNVVAFPRRRMVVRRAVAGMVAAAMLSAMPVVAAASSLPGSPFFGIERWRQNHAISSAHGAEKAFVSESIARKWIGYGSQMTVLDYDPSDIEAVLFRAGELQTQAADLIARHGTKEQIAEMAGMFAQDATQLREILPKAAVSSRAAVEDAIATATGLTRTLVGKLRSLDATFAIPAAVEATASKDGSAGSPKSTTPARGDAKSPDTGEEAPDKVADDTRREYAETAGDACEMIAREQANDLLAGPSKVACTVRDFDPDDWTKK